MIPVSGREQPLARLEAELTAGHTVVLVGPVGSGKTSLLGLLARSFEQAGRPVGLAPRTRCLADVTLALSRAYPSACSQSLTQRHLRSRLRLAAEARPGALLLDHLSAVGPAMKGFLRSLRGTGLGVALAADTEGRRDLLVVRTWRLSHLELALPQLPPKWMGKILDEALAGRPLPHPLQTEDRKLLLRRARGNPGRLMAFMDLLADSQFWRQGRIMAPLVSAAAMERVLHEFLSLAD